MTDDFWVTPKRRLSDLPKDITLDIKISIFQERIEGWQLDIADYLINSEKAHKDAGFAVLDILLSYFEMIAKYHHGYSGEFKSKYYFGKGVDLVFPEYKGTSMSSLLYRGARCGMYHVSTTKNRQIRLEGGSIPSITYDGEKMIINPHKLVSDLKKHFKNYIEKLRDESNSRSRHNFERRFDIDISPKISNPD